MTSAVVVETHVRIIPETWAIVARFATYAEASDYIRDNRGKGTRLRSRIAVSW